MTPPQKRAPQARPRLARVPPPEIKRDLSPEVKAFLTYLAHLENHAMLFTVAQEIANAAMDELAEVALTLRALVDAHDERPPRLTAEHWQRARDVLGRVLIIASDPPPKPRSANGSDDDAPAA